ncbi:MAG: outer membrane beta-barrel protein [Methylovirgula sp.]|nr:outer membrane beta-barrel protein [Methylovirgula sp.]
MSSRTSILCGLLVSVAAASCTAVPAEAADLGSFFSSPQPDIPTQPVEFGTGWYIRGDVGGALQDAPQLLSDVYNVNFSQKLNWSVDIGAGYQFNQWFRTDATYTYYGTYPTNGRGPDVLCPQSLDPVYSDSTDTTIIGVTPGTNTCTPKETASLQKNLFLVNGYVDLGNWAGVTPYIGAGVGAAYLNATQTVNFYNNSDGSPYRAVLSLPQNFPLPLVYYDTTTGLPMNPQPHYNMGAQNWDYSRSVSKWNFAFAMMAGISYDISTNLKLDLGYRYVNFGTMSFKSLSGTLFDKGLTSQEVRLGLRYLVD